MARSDPQTLIARFVPTLSSLARWRLWRSGRGGAGLTTAATAQDPLVDCGRRLRDSRESQNLSLRQLALDTRISTPVLEALERGWRDRLPEATYLRTMLPLIEQRLQLPSGSLDVALPPQEAAAGMGQSRSGLLRRFTPGSIDVFSSWQGTLLYGGLMLGLIYAINLQQHRLAAANLLTLRPIAPLTPAQQNRPATPDQTLLRLHPELRPLQLARRGIAKAALERSPAAALSRNGSPGVLLLTLNQPSQVNLSSSGGARTELRGAQGELALELRTPLQLSITPAPAADAVLWNGTALPGLPQQPGRYRLP
ncbi:MAG: hypothetical protein RLZZ611_358 [Cyanobacteriota bacterium]|jgi:hypothetical protein